MSGRVNISKSWFAEDDNADSALLKTTNLTLVENPGGLGTHSQGGLPPKELAFPTCV